MTETIHLGLPYLAAAQAQKHVTHNEALTRLDAVVQLAVLDTTLTAPPGSPDEGDRYIVAAGATGAWAGHDGEIAAFVDGAWLFFGAGPGWIAFDIAGEAVLVRHGGDWLAAGSFFGAVTRFGVNAAADDTNRLAVRSNAVLFTGIETGSGGSGDVRFTVNKEADGDTASLLFQSGWSGRAEVGLAGDTDFVFKVSPDGSAWTEAIRIDKDTGLSSILYDNALSGLTATTVQDAIDEIAAGGGGGAVASVFGRTGAVVAASGDYDAAEIDFTPAGGIAATNVQAAIAELDGEKLASPGANGIVAHTGAGAAAARTITGTANQIDVTNGNGVSGNPTIAWASTINYTGSLTFNRASATPLGINRTGNDGILITFQRDGSNEGNISVSSGSVTLNGAHLSRWAQWGTGRVPPSPPPRGTVLANLDEKCVWIAERWIDRETGRQRHEVYKGDLKPGDRYIDEAEQETEIVQEANEQLNRVKVSDADSDPGFAGILDTIDDDGDLVVAGRGEFVVRIGKGVSVARGDLLVSAGDGTARPVAGDEAVTLNLLKAIIGKVMTPEKTITYPDGSYLVPVML